MRAKVSIAVVLAIVCLLWAYFTGCGDNNPTGPDQPKDYPVYFWDGGKDNWYFVYHPATNQIDSFHLEYEVFWGIEVSPDGRLLYVADLEVVAVIDLETLEIVAELPYRAQGGTAASPDGQLLAVSGRDALYILSASDYSVVFSDTDRTYYGAFSADSRSFYCSAGWNGSNSGSPYAYKVELADTSFAVTKRVFAHGSPIWIVPSIDKTKWFVYLDCGPASLFQVYDVLSDSIIFSDLLVPGRGELELSSDGRFVFYTNPGSFQVGCPPPSSFTMYDVQKNEIHATISTVGFVEGPHADYLPISDVAITPDGRWLIASYFRYDVLVALDYRTLEVKKYLAIGEPRLPYQLTCQRSL